MTTRCPPDRYSVVFFYARHLDLFDRSRVHLTSRAIQLWPQPCGPHVRPYIGVSLAEPLFEEVEFWLHGRHSSHLSPLTSHLSCRRESPFVVVRNLRTPSSSIISRRSLRITEEFLTEA